MIHIIETNEIPERPAPEIVELMDRASEATRLAYTYRDQVVAHVASLNDDVRRVQVMTLYWRGPQFFRASELAGFLGLSLPAFTKLAKEWQPCRVDKCTSCTRPVIIRKNRDGSETEPLCDQCAHQKRQEEYQHQVAERRTLLLQATEDSAVASIERALIVYLNSNPTGGTFAKLRAMIDADKMPHKFEKAFNSLIRSGRVVPISETPGGTKLYALKKEKTA